MIPLAISLGVLCFLLLLLIILITRKEVKAKCSKCCQRRNTEDEKTTNIETDATAYTSETLVQQTETPTPGSTLSGRSRASTYKSTNSDGTPVYAAVHTKSKKQKKKTTTTTTTAASVDPDIVSDDAQGQTIITPDGVEYFKMKNMTTESKENASRNVPRPVRRAGAYETSTYAFIDHNLTAPPPTMTHRQVSVDS